MERRNFLKAGLALGAIQQVMAAGDEKQVAASALVAASEDDLPGGWIQILTPDPKTDPHLEVRQSAVRLLKQSNMKYLGLEDVLNATHFALHPSAGLKSRLEASFFENNTVKRMEMWGYFSEQSAKPNNLIILFAVEWINYRSGGRKDPRLKMIALNPKYFRGTANKQLKAAANTTYSKVKDVVGNGVEILLIVPHDLHCRHLRRLVEFARDKYNERNELTEVQLADKSLRWTINYKA